MFKIELPRQITSSTVADDAPALELDNDEVFGSAKNLHHSSSQASKASIGYPKFKL